MMTDKYWLKLSLETRAGQAEQLADFLNTSGALSVSLQDSADEAIFEDRPGDSELWPHTCISALYPPATDISSILQQVNQLAGLSGALPHTLEQLQEQNWERVWLDRFHPVQFGQRLWVCPTGHTPPDPNAINLMLDPGLAFGTGTHATTALCLEWLEQADIRDKTLIDYGCGSGILSIAAARLGAHQVWAVDVDPQALEASNSNARQNNVSHLIKTCLPTDLPAMQCDCVIANILATPLIGLAPEFAALLPPKGQLILSGILANEQVDAVMTACQQWFEFQNTARREEWARLDAIRVNDS